MLLTTQPLTTNHLDRTRSARTRRRALQQQLALASVARERCCALKLRACLVEAAQFREEVAAHARQQVIALERRFGGQGIDELQAGRRTEGHRDRDRTV